MKINRGIACNCSEAVVRLKVSDYEQVKAIFQEKSLGLGEGDDFPLYRLLALGSETPVPGYSEMRPHSPDEICIYFYQSDGRTYISILEQMEIPFDTQQWTVGWEWFSPRFDKISEPGGLLVKDIEKLEDRHWDFWRRKPYSDCPPPSDTSLPELWELFE